MIPESLPQVVIATVVAMPGLVYASVRTSLGGYRSSDARLASRVLHAVVAGAILDLVYITLFGSRLVELFTIDAQGELSDLRGVALTALVLGAAVPAAVAALRHGGIQWSVPSGGRLENLFNWTSTRARALRAGVARWFGTLHRTSPFEATPTAWDWSAPHLCDRYVRIRTIDGTFVGGYFGANSYISTFPESRDIFIDEPWELAAHGEFVEVAEQPAGLWIALRDGDIVEWIGPPLSPNGKEAQNVEG